MAIFDPAYDWLSEHDPDAQGVTGEEYRRRRGIQRTGAERAEINRHVPIAADHSYHCDACHERARVLTHTA